MSYTVLCKKCSYVSYAREAPEKSKVNGCLCYHNFETIDIDFVDLVHEFGDYGRVNDYFQCKHCERLFNTIDDKNNHHILDRCLKDSISVDLVHVYDKLFRPEIYFSFFNYVNSSNLLNYIQLDSHYNSWKTLTNLTKLSFKTFIDDLYRLEAYLVDQGLPNFLVIKDNIDRLYTIDFDIFSLSYVLFNNSYNEIYSSFTHFFRHMSKSKKFYNRNTIESMHNSYVYCSSAYNTTITLPISNRDLFKTLLEKYLANLGDLAFITIDNSNRNNYILDKNKFKNWMASFEKPGEDSHKRKRDIEKSIEPTVVNEILIQPQSNGYIYLLQEREFIKTGEPIYKLGKTTKTIQERLQGYPKGSRLILCIEVEDCHEKEKKLLDKFRKEFKLRKDIGNEYFEGDKRTMVKYIR